MEFEGKPHQDIYEKTAGLLKELFGEYCHPDPNFPRFALRMGSALVNISVIPWSGTAVVSANAWVVRKIERTPGLMQFLLDSNGKLVFGAFGMDEEGDVFLRHTIAGSTMDKDELRASVLAIANTADEFDDLIVSRFGGQRAMDPTA